MILTPIDADELPILLDRFGSTLPASGLARAAFTRIEASLDYRDDATDWHRAAVDLARRMGMNPIDEPPQAAFSWDGTRVRTRSEPAVLIHEVAHYQVASPARRGLIDFGLGAGPETGRIAEAEGARRTDDATREAEERLVSLLGILWEVELGQAGIAAFQEQNWLEGAGRPGTAAFFSAVVERLHRLQLINDEARPVMALRMTDDGPDASPPRTQSYLPPERA